MVAESPRLRWVRTHPVTAFFLLTYLFSWSVWLLALPRVAGGGPGVRAAVHTLGLCGPSVAALVLSGLLYGRSGVGELLLRLVRWRVGVGWYVFALLSTLGIGLAALGVHGLAGGANPSPNLQLLNAGALTAGLPEEYGWRGFALPHLLKKRSAVAASLVIGLFWVLWHFPIAPGLRNPPVLGLMLLEVLALSILFSWLYVGSGGSILLVCLYHLAVNAVVVVLGIPTSPSLWAIYLALLWLAALAVIVRYGGASLARRAAVVEPVVMPRP